MSWLKSKITTTASVFIVKRVLKKIFKRIDAMNDGSWKSVVTVIAIAVIAIAVGFFAGYSTKKVPQPEVVYVDVPVTVRDTVKVEVPPVSHANLPAQSHAGAKPVPVTADTSDADLGEPADTTMAEAAYLDLVLKSHEEEYGRLLLAYRIPLNVFDVDFYPTPRKEITVTKYIYKDAPWYAKPIVTVAAGVVAGIAIERLR